MLLGALGRPLKDRPSTVASGAALKRLKEKAEFYLGIREALETSVKRLGAIAKI